MCRHIEFNFEMAEQQEETMIEKYLALDKALDQVWYEGLLNKLPLDYPPSIASG